MLLTRPSTKSRIQDEADDLRRQSLTIGQLQKNAEQRKRKLYKEIEKLLEESQYEGDESYAHEIIERKNKQINDIDKELFEYENALMSTLLSLIILSIVCVHEKEKVVIMMI